ncbi:hypothetical protein H5410_031343 [Solanum commersonii]|uniref:Uncharacterized protein n=1 Tax=Solanum commersonii TaxID=4109 RepID=A0A9J5YIW1_SOLCO|nr:hypothetical protein H5410_031343 [Solanum commersonii]
MEACLHGSCVTRKSHLDLKGDKIRSEVIRRRWEWPQWWTRRSEAEMVWTCEKAVAEEVRGLVVESAEGRGRPKKYWGVHALIWFFGIVGLNSRSWVERRDVGLFGELGRAR